ncbi:helix-turn-helix domain-containing protein [Actinoplanes oblitus]|uniref:Helix-turn-helix domain-containing protein n=1 Tax=Actinoplanes oblitus TaxID=3040509 RepID=A0ABY8W9U1_9ACTN|nr:helix-turn-helix domain-containing protein [Actinoplanes oblitus]WIM94267.1 helix-turn-helix domain-containing protein [Actinoplanes oblitus]
MTAVQPYASGQLVKAALLASKDLGKTERAVLVTVAAHGNGMGDAFPSVATIADYVGVSERTVSRVLAKLVALGRLVARIRKGATTVYRLTVEAINRVVKPRQNEATPPTDQATTPDTQEVSPEVGSKLGSSKGGFRRFFPSRVSNPQTSPVKPWERRGAALPPAAGEQKCHRHPGQLARNCGACRAEALGGGL